MDSHLLNVIWLYEYVKMDYKILTTPTTTTTYVTTLQILTCSKMSIKQNTRIVSLTSDLTSEMVR